MREVFPGKRIRRVVGVYAKRDMKPGRDCSGDLSVTLGYALDFVLLLDGVAVSRAFGSVDQLVGQTFGDGLGTAEGGVTGATANEVDALVHSA